MAIFIEFLVVLAVVWSLAARRAPAWAWSGAIALYLLT
jgi:hypothetical protein